MRRVAILGVGNTQFRARWTEKTYLQLAWDAASAAQADAALAALRDAGEAAYLIGEIAPRGTGTALRLR
jgi:acetyl-CoA acetyltransferase